MMKKKETRELVELGMLLVAALWLFCAAGSRWEYGVYMLMRFFIAYVAVQMALWHRKLLLPLIAIAVLYQPLLKIPLSREIWTAINLLTATGTIVLMVWLIKCKKYLVDVFLKEK